MIVPRFLSYFLSAYSLMLESGPGSFDPEADRRELRFLLTYVSDAPLVTRLLARTPYPIARLCYRAAMKLPLRRYLRQRVRRASSAGLAPDTTVRS